MWGKLIDLTAGGAFLAWSSTAYAISITNRDSTDHSFRMSEGVAERTVVIQSNETLDYLCLKGCTITLVEGDPIYLDGSEIVIIQGGKIKAATVNIE